MMLCDCYTDNQAWLMINDIKKLSPIPDFGICAVFRHRAKAPGQVGKMMVLRLPPHSTTAERLHFTNYKHGKPHMVHPFWFKEQ